MRLIDLSQPIASGGPNCPDDPAVRSQLIADHPAGGWRLELLTFTAHTASHLDAPLHRLPEGRAIDGYPLDAFTGPAWIADLRDSQPGLAVGPDLLAQRLAPLPSGAIVLLATGWCQRRGHSDLWRRHSPWLSCDGAQWLVDRGVRGVGIDHYSIGGSQSPHNQQTHDVLLRAGVWVLEDLRLEEDALSLPQPVQLMALPLNLPGHSGAPCRPVIIVEEP